MDCACLCEERVHSGLVDDEVTPLYHHYTREEGSVARVLQGLPLVIRLKRSSKSWKRLKLECNTGNLVGNANCTNCTNNTNCWQYW